MLQKYQFLLSNVYEQHNPEKLADIDKLIRKHLGLRTLRCAWHKSRGHKADLHLCSVFTRLACVAREPQLVGR